MDALKLVLHSSKHIQGDNSRSASERRFASGLTVTRDSILATTLPYWFNLATG